MPTDHQRPASALPDTEGWRRLQQLFHDALARDPAARPEFLDRACAGDSRLRRQLADLLDASAKADGVLSEAVRSSVEIAAATVGGLRRVGPYRLLRVLGRGGFSTVYLAERADDDLRIQVAGIQVAGHCGRVAGDLDRIVPAALRREPERYSSALACRLQKFVPRRRAGAAAAVAVLLLVTVVGGLSTARLQRERDRAGTARAEAERAAAAARQISDFLRDLLANADPERAHGAEVTARAVLERGAAEIERLAGQPELQASLMTLMGRVYQRLGQPEQAQPLLECALAIRRRRHGDGSVETARSEIELAELLYELGDLVAAVESSRPASNAGREP